MPPIRGFPGIWEENLVQGLYIDRYRSPRRSWKSMLGKGTSGIPWCHRHGCMDGWMDGWIEAFTLELRFAQLHSKHADNFHLPNTRPVPTHTEWLGTQSTWHRHHWPLCPSLVQMHQRSSYHIHSLRQTASVAWIRPDVNYGGGRWEKGPVSHLEGHEWFWHSDRRTCWVQQSDSTDRDYPLHCNNVLLMLQQQIQSAYIMSFEWIVCTQHILTTFQNLNVPFPLLSPPLPPSLFLSLSLAPPLPSLRSPSLIQLYHDSAAQPLQHDSTFLSLRPSLPLRQLADESKRNTGTA